MTFSGVTPDGTIANAMSNEPERVEKASTTDVTRLLGDVAAGNFGYAIAVGLACLGFGVRLRMPRFVRLLATTTFGIYLLHPLVVLGANQLIALDSLPPVADAALVWGASSVLVIALGLVFRSWPECGRRQSA